MIRPSRQLMSSQPTTKHYRARNPCGTAALNGVPVRVERALAEAADG